MVKNLPTIWETQVQPQGREDTLEKGTATHSSILGFPGGSAGKESAYNMGDLGSIPGLGRSPGEGKGYPPSVLAWRIPVQSRTRLSTNTCTFVVKRGALKVQ